MAACACNERPGVKCLLHFNLDDFIVDVESKAELNASNEKPEPEGCDDCPH